MLFVLKKAQLQRMIAITRDDRSAKTIHGADAPFFRIEASGESVTLSGREVEATIPASVYEPGVLFLKVTLFRRLLATFKGEDQITLQVNQDGLHIGNVRIPLEPPGWLLYADPARAPKRHPDDEHADEEARKVKIKEAREEVQRLEDELAEARIELRKLDPRDEVGEDTLF